jgi:hypothetical protein
LLDVLAMDSVMKKVLVSLPVIVRK